MGIRCPPRRQLTTIPISISMARTRGPFAVVDFDIADKLAPSAITSSMFGDAEYAARAGLQLVSGYTILVLSTNILLSSLTMVTHLVQKMHLFVRSRLWIHQHKLRRYLLSICPSLNSQLATKRSSIPLLLVLSIRQQRFKHVLLGSPTHL